MRHKKPFIIMVGAFLVMTLAVVVTPALAGKPLLSKAPVVEDVFTWKLSNPKVVDPPEISNTKEGFLAAGYTIEADAAGVETASPEVRGKFRLTLTVFSPKKDMPGQRAGAWYVRGSWTIIDQNQDADAEKARYAPGNFKGDLMAELFFNPLAQGGAILARVRLPMSPQGGSWGSGQGIFTGDQLFAGEMSVTLNRRLATK